MMQKILILVMIIGGLTSCSSKLDIDEAREQYEIAKKAYQADSIKKVNANKNRYQFEYYQDPKTGLCYSILHNKILTYYGEYIVKSHTCIPCKEAVFSELNKPNKNEKINPSDSLSK